MFKIFSKIKTFIRSVEYLIRILKILINNTELSEKDKDEAENLIEYIEQALKDFKNDNE